MGWGTGRASFAWAYLTILSGLIFLAACSQKEAIAADYFVRADGSDTLCNGTVDAAAGNGDCAWQTISKAVTQLVPGDTVAVGNGIYRLDQLQVSLRGTENNPITFRASGSAVILSGAKPVDETKFVKTVGYQNIYEIRFSDLPGGGYDPVRQRVTQIDGVTAWQGYRAQNTQVELQGNFFQWMGTLAELDLMPKGASLGGGGSTLYVHTSDGRPPVDHEIEVSNEQFDRMITLSNASYITFDGFIIRNGGFWMINSNDHITFRNIEAISSLMVTGTSLNDSDNVIENLFAHDGLYGIAEKVNVATGEYSAGGGCCGVWIHGTRPVLRNALIEEMWNATSLANSVDAIIENSVFRDNPNHSTYANVGTINTTIRNSIYARNQDTLYLDGAQGLNFHHNIMDGPVIFQAIKSGVPPTNIDIRNCILMGFALSNADPIIDPSGDGNVAVADFTSDYNLFVPEGGYDQSGNMEIGESTTNTLSDWLATNAAIGRLRDQHSIEANGSALFIDWMNDDLRPVAGALSIDAGDISIQGQFIGAAPDIGAYELGDDDSRQYVPPAPIDPVDPPAIDPPPSNNSGNDMNPGDSIIEPDIGISPDGLGAEGTLASGANPTTSQTQTFSSGCGKAGTSVPFPLFLLLPLLPAVRRRGNFSLRT